MRDERGIGAEEPPRPPAITMSNAAIAAASGASAERFFGSAGRAVAGFACGRDADLQRIDPDWLVDVLELRRAEIGDREIEPPLTWR